jgi:cytochrome c biogenesis protein CcdA/thiol-disulfide isomerase/thioredoxin
MISTDSISSALLGFLEGVSIIASPCIWSVLPIVLSSSIAGGPLRPYGIISGFIVTFFVFTLTSRWLIELLHLDPVILRQASFILLILLAILMLSEKLSQRFDSIFNPVAQLGTTLQQQLQPTSGFGSGLLIGGCIGLVWAPCSGPILAAVLVQAIQQKTNFSSVLTLLAFSLGAGLPMLLIAVGGQFMMHKLAFIKQQGVLIRKMTGVVILLTVLLTAQDTWGLPSLSSLFNQAPSTRFVKHGTPEPTYSPTSRLINQLPQPYPAPAFMGIEQWINTKPLTMASLKGKVVLVDFWTYSCVNCIRTLPYITAWDEKYRQAGLVIVGIHAPEFAFERKPENVTQAVKKYNIQYPVALDNELKTWESFDNSAWPAHYLINREGKVVYTHFGEGQYDITEKNIQTLLGQKNEDLVKGVTTEHSILQTPETYLGFSRGFQLENPSQQFNLEPFTYTFPQQLPLNKWALEGIWKRTEDYIETKEKNASLKLHFRAKKVFIVLGGSNSTAKPVTVQPYLNGNSIGKPILVVNHQLYTVLDLPEFQTGLLELKALDKGLQAYAFTFEA